MPLGRTATPPTSPTPSGQCRPSRASRPGAGDWELVAGRSLRSVDPWHRVRHGGCACLGALSKQCGSPLLPTTAFGPLFHGTLVCAVPQPSAQNAVLTRRAAPPALASHTALIRFKVKETGQRVCFVNTHFDHEAEEARVKAADLLLAQLPVVSEGLATVVVGGRAPHICMAFLFVGQRGGVLGACAPATCCMGPGFLTACPPATQPNQAPPLPTAEGSRAPHPNPAPLLGTAPACRRPQLRHRLASPL